MKFKKCISCVWIVLQALILTPCLPALGDSYNDTAAKASDLFKSGNYSDAFDQARQAIQMDDKRYEAYFIAGLALDKQDQDGLAAGYFQKALDRAPENEMAHVQEALAAETAKNQFNEDILDAQNAEQSGLRNKAAREYAAAWNEQPGREDVGMKAVQIYIDLQDWAHAAGILSVMAADPNNLEAAGKARDQLNQIRPQAEPAYQTEVQKVQALCMQGTNDEAIAAAQNLVNIWPNRPEGHFELARALSARNQLEGAQQALTLAVKYGNVDLSAIFTASQFQTLATNTQAINLLIDAYGSDPVMQAKAQGDQIKQSNLQQEENAAENERRNQEIQNKKLSDEKEHWRNLFCGKWIPNYGKDIVTKKSDGYILITEKSDDTLEISGSFTAVTYYQSAGLLGGDSYDCTITGNIDPTDFTFAHSIQDLFDYNGESSSDSYFNMDVPGTFSARKHIAKSDFSKGTLHFYYDGNFQCDLELQTDSETKVDPSSLTFIKKDN